MYSPANPPFVSPIISLISGKFAISYLENKNLYKPIKVILILTVK